ncbi:MAG: metal-dependent hydrolase [Spirosomaceae bacterium]|jgi:inner membrane protein|nr:metal-dependent hydrolase [Spirosomataceae bacterium]
MQGFNHVAGGIAFTGIFASFTDTNIFEKPEYLAVTVITAVLPDIDHTKSIIGKLFYPLAKWLNNSFGHRTITHSLIFLIAIWLIVRFLELIYFKDSNYSTIVFYALFSHDLFDMCTKQGVPFFYPFTKRPVVLPANPNLRLSTNDFRSEAIIFLGFCSLTLFCMPLFSNGFWQVYRKAFLSYKQIQIEATKSKDMLEITYSTKANDTTKAILLSINDGKMIVFNSKEFIQVDNPREINFIDFRHTKQPFKTKEIQLFNVSADSLKSYLNLRILKGEIQCSQDMNWFDGAILKTGKNISLEFKNGFNFSIQTIDNTQIESKIEVEKAKKSKEINEFNKIQARINELEDEIYFGQSKLKNLSDFERGKMIEHLSHCKEEIKKLELIEYPYLAEIDKEIEGLEKELKAKSINLNANLLIWITE